MQDKNLLEIILGESIHEEILKKSFNIFYLYIKKQGLNNTVYDELWKAYLEKHESIATQIQQLICDIVQVAPEKDRRYMFAKLSDLHLEKFNKNIIEFIKDFTVNSIKASLSNDDGTNNTKSLYGIPIFWQLIKDCEDVNLVEYTIKKFMEIFQSVEIDNEIIQNYIFMCLENIKIVNNKIKIGSKYSSKFKIIHCFNETDPFNFKRLLQITF